MLMQRDYALVAIRLIKIETTLLRFSSKHLLHENFLHDAIIKLDNIAQLICQFYGKIR